DAVRRLGQDPAVPVEDRAGRKVQLAPPGHVGEVAEGADHGDAGALVGLGEVMGDDRHLDAEQRGAHGRADELAVAVVVGVGDQSTESPTRRQTSSNAFSSISVSRLQSSTKLRRETGICLVGLSGGSKDGSYGSEGSQRTPK